jgi:hypothetical protein
LESTQFDHSTGAFSGLVPASLEGEIHVRLALKDRAGNAGKIGHGPGAPLKVTVDDTPPKPASLTGNAISRSNDFGLEWDPAAGEKDDEFRAVHIRLCAAADPERCAEVAPALAEDQLAVDHLAMPGQGSYTAEIWLEDRYGNADPASASNQVRLIYDATPPAGRFLPAEEREVTAELNDPGDGSGVAGCRIEARPGGGLGPFVTVAGSGLDGDRCRGRLGESVAPGPYELRAVATDAAGNEGVIGGPEAVAFIRYPVRMDVSAPSRPVSRRSPVTITVRLTDSRGPVARAPVEIGMRAARRGSSPVTRTAATDGAGWLRIDLPPGPSRLVFLRYAGDAQRLGAARRVKIRTKSS